MSDIDDEEKLRISDEEDLDDFGRQFNPPSPSGAIVLATTFEESTYPTTDATFYACDVSSVTGDETEGSPGTVDSASTTIYAYLPVGGAIPAQGDEVVCVHVDYRWVIVP